MQYNKTLYINTKYSLIRLKNLLYILLANSKYGFVVTFWFILSIGFLISSYDYVVYSKQDVLNMYDSTIVTLCLIMVFVDFIFYNKTSFFKSSILKYFYIEYDIFFHYLFLNIAKFSTVVITLLVIFSLIGISYELMFLFILVVFMSKFIVTLIHCVIIQVLKTLNISINESFIVIFNLIASLIVVMLFKNNFINLLFDMSISIKIILFFVICLLDGIAHYKIISKFKNKKRVRIIRSILNDKFNIEFLLILNKYIVNVLVLVAIYVVILKYASIYGYLKQLSPILVDILQSIVLILFLSLLNSKTISFYFHNNLSMSKYLLYSYVVTISTYAILYAFVAILFDNYTFILLLDTLILKTINLVVIILPITIIRLMFYKSIYYEFMDLVIVIMTIQIVRFAYTYMGTYLNSILYAGIVVILCILQLFIIFRKTSNL